MVSAGLRQNTSTTKYAGGDRDAGIAIRALVPLMVPAPGEVLRRVITDEIKANQAVPACAAALWLGRLPCFAHV